MPSARILIAEDDRAIRDALVRALRLEGYEPVGTEDGATALTALAAPGGAPHSFDLLLLDVMMPRVDGLTLCRVLRAQGDRIPILMLTARTGTGDRVAGLDAGADDYLPKPFELAELLARVRALLRRSSFEAGGRDAQGPAGGDGALQVGDLRLDPATRRTWRAGREIELTRTEFDLLELLMRNAGIVLTHETIYDRIWGYDFGPESKNLAVYISYLRRKVEPDGVTPLIRTIRGVGYTVREA